MKRKLLFGFGTALILSGALLVTGYSRYNHSSKTTQHQEGHPVELTEVETPKNNVESEPAKVSVSAAPQVVKPVEAAQAAPAPAPQTKEVVVTVVSTEEKCDLPTGDGGIQYQKYTYYSDGSVKVTQLPAYCVSKTHVVNTGN